MKLRNHSFLLALFLIVAFLFIYSLPVSGKANPILLHSEDALIRQVLTNTAKDLGWSTSIMYDVSDDGIPEWLIYDAVNGDIFNTNLIQISEYNSPAAAKTAFQNYIAGEPGSLTDFHGQPAFYSTESDMTNRSLLVQVDQFLFLSSSVAGDNVRERLEVCYNNAVALGLISGEVGETVLVTPQAGATITLNSSAENYEEESEYIDNSANFGTVTITGRVTDLESGNAIEGATIKIVSGAASATTSSAADGSYTLTANVSGGEDSGEATGIDFALSAKTEEDIQITPSQSELNADGSSTTEITIQVKDLEGKPLENREFSLVASGDVGPGTIYPELAITDSNGTIHATYTTFKLEPGTGGNETRHEVTISARDNTTGVTASTSVYVNQYQVSAVYGEYIPACNNCAFPSTFTISVTDYWNNPIANASLNVHIESGSPSGTLVLDAASKTNQQEISLTTDSSGRATFYFKWLGSVDITEAVQHVVVLDETTNTTVSKDVKVHGIDISIARVEEAGFTGVTGQQAFLKIYFTERAHPDLLLDRFNSDSPNKLGLRVAISQYHSDGVNTSLTFDDVAGWEEDAGGLFIKMFTTPHMPYVIPVNDGTSWYEVRVDPVVDQDVYLPDLYRPNNDTIIALTTGSPDGWLHMWLKDGILTPHSWTGVVFKCVGRFLPGISQAMTVIDTLNQAYSKDVLGLGQSTAQVLTDALENSSSLPSPDMLQKNNLTKASATNNIVSCLQDSYSVYSKNGNQSNYQPI